MGYYPPLTDYLADWRMDKIKGEDLQDPTARAMVSTLGASVSTLASSVTTLSTQLANKKDSCDPRVPAWRMSYNGRTLTLCPTYYPSSSPIVFSTGPDPFFQLTFDTSLTPPSWTLRGSEIMEEVVGSTDSNATSLTFSWTWGGASKTATLTRIYDSPITYYSQGYQEINQQFSGLQSDIDFLSYGYGNWQANGSGTISVQNRTVTYVSMVDDIVLEFPQFIDYHSRDFIVQVGTADSSDHVIDLPFTDSDQDESAISYGVPEGENLSDMTTIESNVYAILYFSEFQPHCFAVHRVNLDLQTQS